MHADDLTLTRRLAVVRVLVGLYTLGWLAAHHELLSGRGTPPRAGFAPVGVVSVLTDSPPSPPVTAAVAVATAIAAVGLVTNRRVCGSAAVIALGLLWLGTYRSSWGQVFHTDNLVVLHAAVLAVTGLDDRDPHPPRWRLPDDDAVRLIQVLTVATYVLAGVAKLRSSSAAWLIGDDLRNWVAFDNLRKAELGDVHSPLGSWLVAHPWVWPPVALATLAVELGAPLALRGGRWTLAWVGAAWVFHVGVLGVMAIGFPYALTGFQFAAFLPAERVSMRPHPPAPAPADQLQATGRDHGPATERARR